MEQGDAYFATASVASLKGVGGSFAQKLQSQGVLTLFDLLLDLPFRYLDETRITKAREAKVNGREQLFCLKVCSSQSFTTRSGKRLFTVTLEDDSARMQALFFNSWPGFSNQFQSGRMLMAFGQVKRGMTGMACLQHPSVHFLDPGEEPLVQSTLTPVYHSPGKMPQKTLRRLIAETLEKLRAIPLPELLPASLRPGGLDINTAIALTHRPAPPKDSEAVVTPEELPSFRRLCFEELTAYELMLLSLKRINRNRRSLPLKFDAALHQKLLSSLGFALTPSQDQAFNEIMADLSKPVPMLRLLHGDVGSGKTLVALLACLQAAGNGVQSVLLAPTELLARQHYGKFLQILSPLGVRCALLYSGQKKAERAQVLEEIAQGRAQVVIGTHSLFQPEVAYKALTLAVIDEQHRFGVEQRAALLRKAPEGTAVHQLVMTATPIPRTQQLALFADLDVSTLKELPSGRTPVTTAIMDDSRRGDIIKRLREVCSKGAQAYWICPRIDEGDEEDDSPLASVKEIHALLTRQLPGIKVGLLHGQMGSDEKTKVMEKFLKGEISVLAATTIVEVGVDVPNASIIVIDGAQGLGLAQLHQLRGRVGRGRARSYCILVYKRGTAGEGSVAWERLKIMRKTTDGFKIAEADLKLRGPGEILGHQQTGFNLFRVADAGRDHEMFKDARAAAEQILPDNERARALIGRWFHGFSVNSGTSKA